MAASKTPANQQAMWNRIRASQKSNIRAVSGKGNTTLFSSGAVGSTVAGFMGTPALTTLALANKETRGYVNKGVLNLGYDRLDDSKTVAEWREKFPRAKHLNVSNRLLTDADFQYFAGLESLNISECTGFTDAAFVHLRGIKKLDVSSCKNITDSAFAHLDGIHTLIMGNCNQPGITDTAFTHLRGIHTLDMNRCWISTDNPAIQSGITGSALAHLVGIHTLNISHCRQFTDDNIVHLKGIKELNIEGTEISDRAFEYLQGIHTLSIYSINNRITGAGFVHLKGIHTLSMPEFFGFPEDEFAHLKGIKVLNISGCDLSDRALSYLEGIHTLEMARCDLITDAGIAYLKGIHNIDMRYCYQDTLTGDNLASLGCNLKTLEVFNSNKRLINNAMRVYGVTEKDPSVKKYPIECSRTPGRLGFKLPALYQSGGGRQTRKGKRKSRKMKSRKRR